MSIYREYTLTSTETMIVFFKCEKCGGHNLVPLKVSTVSGYNDKHALRQKTIEKRKNDAEERLKTYQAEKHAKILTDAERHSFRSAGLKCRCVKCGHKAPWTKFSTGFTDSLLSFGLFVLVFTACATYLGLHWKYLVGLLTAMSVLLIYKYVHIWHTSIQVSKMQSIHLPIIADSIEMLTQKIGSTFDDKDIERS